MNWNVWQPQIGVSQAQPPIKSTTVFLGSCTLWSWNHGILEIRNSDCWSNTQIRMVALCSPNMAHAALTPNHHKSSKRKHNIMTLRLARDWHVTVIYSTVSTPWPLEDVKVLQQVAISQVPAKKHCENPDGGQEVYRVSTAIQVDDPATTYKFGSQYV